jgi:hypothetical protein
MSETKHTPGPWQFVPTAAGEHQLLCGQNAGEGILLVKHPARGRVNPADKALIKAAPDLLDACKKARAMLEGLDPPAGPWTAYLQSLKETLDAAISRASS